MGDLMAWTRPQTQQNGERDIAAATIETWIALKLEDALELDRGEIDVNEPFDRYGLDSSEAVTLISDLEDWLGRELPANLVYEYPSIADLAQYLARSE